MNSPLVALDGLLDPMIKAALRVRQVRDALPESLWHFVPDQIRVPLDELFVAIERYDARIGALKDVGLFD